MMMISKLKHICMHCHHQHSTYVADRQKHRNFYAPMSSLTIQPVRLFLKEYNITGRTMNKREE